MSGRTLHLVIPERDPPDPAQGTPRAPSILEAAKAPMASLTALWACPAPRRPGWLYARRAGRRPATPTSRRAASHSDARPAA